MNIAYEQENGVNLAVVSGSGKAIVDVRSALDLVMTVKYEGTADRIAIEKNLIAEDFFILSTGMAGEILQKFMNYRVKAAIWGDFSRYTSKPLHDFIYESNRGNSFFFVPTREEAVRRLSEAT